MACIALLVASCDDTDAGTGGNENLAVQFNPYIKEQLATRAVNTAWSATDEVGIYMVSDGANLPVDAVFSQYRVSGAGESVGLIPTAADQTLYYPPNGDDVHFIAFSPYVEQTGNRATYSGFADQSTSAGIQKVDVLYSNDGVAFNRTSSSASLTFSHQMSKLVIKVTTAGAVSEQIDLTGLTIEVAGMPASAGLNLADGTVEASPVKAVIKPYHTNGAAGERVATAIVTPHDGVAGRGISFKLSSADGEGTFGFSIPSDNVFAPGRVYVMEFVATRQGVTLVDTESLDWAGGHVVWDDEYALSLEETVVVVPAIAAGATRSIEFKTNNKTVSQPDVKYSTSATDADAGTPGWVSPGSVDADTSAPNHNLYRTSFTISGAPNASSFYVHIAVGGLKAVVDVQLASANCVMLPLTGATAFIPVNRANEYTTFVGATTPAIGAADALTAEVLWSDTNGLLTTVEAVGTGADGIIKVVSAPGKAGNAVVAVKVGGEIKWSWHVWVVDYDPDNGGGTFTNTYNTNDNGKSFIFMDRNLGATFAGTGYSLGTDLFYQWGRKDPFPATGNSGDTQPGGGSFTFANTNAERGTVANAIQNPTVFLGSDDGSSRDWLWIGDNTLWGHGTLKSIYDPCPAGWRVPSFANNGENDADSPWAGFTVSNGTFDRLSGGWTWGTHAAYPAAGLRNYINGGVAVGSNGYYWSSLVSSTTAAYSLNFYSSTVNTRYSDPRSFGYSVRCVSDSTNE